MKSVLFSFGSIHLYSYGLCIAIGVLLALFLMERRAKKEGFPGVDHVFDLTFSVLIWGFAGARLFYVAQDFPFYWREPFKIFAVWEGGLIFYGGAIFSIFGFWLTVRKKSLPFWRSMDFIIPYGVLVHAFGRIGCFMNGCCYGKVCDFPWCVKFPEVAHKVHPTQLYEAAFDLLLCVYLLSRRKKFHFEGQIALLYFLLYGVGRYLIEFFREPSWLWLGLTSNQWLSVAIAVVSFVFFKLKQRKVT
ncbi:MAG TPA: prolipoprotein diacylglyceryl transferase [Candidatus Omnitrophota bacterium]|nr:prolipoprotein diacylglyceryl transferase [Candidatus Omnitrophota bacterium]